MGKIIPLCTLQGHTDRVWSVAWSPDGQFLASCSGDATVRVWVRKARDVMEQQQSAQAPPGTEFVCLAVLSDGHQRAVRRVAWSPDGQVLAAASFDSTCTLWRMGGGGMFECIATVEGHENEVKGVAFHANGLLATCSRDKSVWVWEVADDPLEPGLVDCQCLAVCHGHAQDVKCVTWHPFNEVLFSASYDDTIRVWQSDADEEWFCAGVITGHESTVWDLAFNRSTGTLLASAGADQTVRVWRPTAAKSSSGDDNQEDEQQWYLSCTITGLFQRAVYSVDVNDDNEVVAGGGDNAIRVFRPRPTPERMETDDGGVDEAPVHMSFVHSADALDAHVSDVNCVRWNPMKQDLIASCGDDRLVRLWQFIPEDEDFA